MRQYPGVALERRLADIVGPSQVLSDPEIIHSYVVDRTGSFHGEARAVVRPADTAETAACVAACVAEGVAVVPQGGNTGLVGGSTSERGHVLISLQRLAQLEVVDPAARQVVAGAGATLQSVQEAAAASELVFPIDHGARSQATIGGTVATNAGGALAWKYGMTRALVIGIEAVLADGAVLTDMSPLAKDNSGYDLPGLFTGSEGTLGVVTAARLRLVPLFPHSATALVGVESLDTAVKLFVAARVAPELEAGEFFSQRCMQLVTEHLGVASPLPDEHPYYALLEFSTTTSEGAHAALGGAIASIPQHAVAVAQDERQRRQLWEYRERQNEALTAAGGGRKFDLAVMPPAMGSFLDSVSEALQALDPAVDIYAFGHLGDGNIHLNALGLPDQDAAAKVVYETVDAFDGTVSAEHGVGRLKKPWLPLVRSPQELGVMRAIKKSLDPHNLMNPGVLFD